ncbi:MAG: PAS domain-containing protein [Peptoniphilaceae bacterium]
MEKDLKNILKIDQEKAEKLLVIKGDFLDGKISLEEAKKKVNESVDNLNSYEFAYVEQLLKERDYSDDLVTDNMENLLFMVEDVLKYNDNGNLDSSHPINSYLRENKEVKKILDEIEILKNKKFIKNQWLEIYDKLEEFKIHLSRKQNQLYPALENVGFDRPSKIMWTFDNAAKDSINKGKELLEEDKEDEFLLYQNELIEKVKDIINKEEEVLFPTALELLSQEDFRNMSQGDKEIGYCLIEEPKEFLKTEENKVENEFMDDLAKLMDKYIMGNSNREFDVSQGKLTLEQINLIFKNMPVDLSYVDENEIMKFYTDTKHRVFPRSKGVIGRDVKNCHPRESVEVVERIITAFREKKQSKAEFWLEIGGKFIYILYTAIYDDQGNFKGVLEMMQDATHIRSLKGSQRLLSWDSEEEDTIKESEISNKYNIKGDTIIGDLIEEYPFIKDYIMSLSPKYEKLNNPLIFKTMSKIANLEMIAQRGNFDLEDFINKIVMEIDKENNKK